MKSVKLKEDEEYGLGFAASLIDGTSIDLFDLVDLECTEELETAVWDKYNWRSLIQECDSAQIIEIEEHEGGPGMSDTFYWVAIHDLEDFRRELRGIMLAAKS